jgi:hypothetical protein
VGSCPALQCRLEEAEPDRQKACASSRRTADQANLAQPDNSRPSYWTFHGTPHRSNKTGIDHLCTTAHHKCRSVHPALRSLDLWATLGKLAQNSVHQVPHRCSGHRSLTDTPHRPGIPGAPGVPFPPRKLTLGRSTTALASAPETCFSIASRSVSARSTKVELAGAGCGHVSCSVAGSIDTVRYVWPRFQAAEIGKPRP